MQSKYVEDSNLYNAALGTAGAIIASVDAERDPEEFAAARCRALTTAGTRVARSLLAPSHQSAIDRMREEGFLAGMPGSGQDRWAAVTDLDVIHSWGSSICARILAVTVVRSPIRRYGAL